MSGVTEIYVCRNGQKLKEGKLVLAHDVTNRDEAASDAERRCTADSSIERIAYYALSPDGNFRNLFTYTNPNVRAKPAPAKTIASSRRKKTPAAKKPAKKSLIERVMAVFRGG